MPTYAPRPSGRSRVVADYSRGSPLNPFVVALRRRGSPRLTARYTVILAVLDAAAKLLCSARELNPPNTNDQFTAHDSAYTLIQRAIDLVRLAAVTPTAAPTM